MPLVRLLVADQNRAMLELLQELLQEKYEVVARVTSGVAVLEQSCRLDPDVVVIDVSLGDLTGFEVARRLRHYGSKAKVIILSMYESGDFIRAAFQVGVSGYVFKSCVISDLPAAIDAVCRGGIFRPIAG